MTLSDVITASPTMSSYIEAWLPGPQSTQIYTRTFTSPSPKALIVFVHGFQDHVGRNSDLLQALSSRGFNVFAFDQRGFGRTALDEKRSKHSYYGRTCWKEQMEDVEWAVKHAKSHFENLPIFLMGQSMGGGLCLAFATRSNTPPSPSTVSLLSGIIATSPLLKQTNPANKLLRWTGTKISYLTPNMFFPVAVNVNDLSHDSKVFEAASKDPLIKNFGSLKGIRDMLDGGENLISSDHTNWPASLPVLITHGSDDKVTSPKASEEFFNRLTVKDKTLSLYPGAYHELFHETDTIREKAINEYVSWIEAHLSPARPTSRL